VSRFDEIVDAIDLAGFDHRLGDCAASGVITQRFFVLLCDHGCNLSMMQAAIVAMLTAIRVRMTRLSFII